MSRGRGKRTALAHQLAAEAEAAVCAHDAEAGDVPVRDAVGGLLFDLGEHVADDLGVVVGRLGRAGDLGVG
jgi:hypothetical protein